MRSCGVRRRTMTVLAGVLAGAVTLAGATACDAAGPAIDPSFGAKSFGPLLAIATDLRRSTCVRAAAAARALPYVRRESAEDVRPLLTDPEPLVRLVGLRMLERVSSASRPFAAAPLLSDPSGAVRMEAARLLANADEARLSPEQRAAKSRARDEYLASLAAHPASALAAASLASFALREGRTADAIASWRRAIELDPGLASSYVALADALRLERREQEAEAVVRDGLAKLPEEASLHRKLGTLLLRRGDRDGGLAELELAVRYGGGDPEHAKAYATALHSFRRVDEALAVLEKADREHPYDAGVLETIVGTMLEDGRGAAALPYAKRLAEIVPDDPDVVSLVERLERGASKRERRKRRP